MGQDEIASGKHVVTPKSGWRDVPCVGYTLDARSEPWIVPSLAHIEEARHPQSGHHVLKALGEDPIVRRQHDREGSQLVRPMKGRPLGRPPLPTKFLYLSEVYLHSLPELEELQGAAGEFWVPTLRECGVTAHTRVEAHRRVACDPVTYEPAH